MAPEKPKRVIPFRNAIEAVCEKYGFADWAIVARAVDGTKKAWWIGGDGNNPIGDEERSGLLLFEMAKLQASIVEMAITPKPAPKPKPPPPPAKS